MDRPSVQTGAVNAPPIVVATEKLSATPSRLLHEALLSDGLRLDLGAFSVRIRSRCPEIAGLLQSVYPHFPFELATGFVDATVDLFPASGLRRWVRAQAFVEIDGIDPFGPIPRDELLPHFEWAVNWAFANMMSTHLLLHSGTVEIDGRGVLLIAQPGSGKSTLTAGLIGRGARLLSDEFGVLRLSDGMLLPIIKPIALKNQSIETLRAWSPDCRMGPTFPNTRKGHLAHMAAPMSAVSRVREPARPRLVIFPQFRQGGVRSLLQVAPARAFMEIGINSFNYDLLRASGFKAVSSLVEQCAFYRFEYASLRDAVDTVFELCGQREQVPAGALA